MYGQGGRNPYHPGEFGEIIVDLFSGIYYDLISPLYDLFTHAFYRAPAVVGRENELPARPDRASPRLRNRQGFEYIVPHIGPGGLLVGIDLSEAMLRRAERRVRKHGWRMFASCKGT